MPSSNSDSKRIVRYREDRLHYIRVGQPALCCPVLDQPTDDVTGDGETPVSTSIVTAVNVLTGEFWTRNSHYVPCGR